MFAVSSRSVTHSVIPMRAPQQEQDKVVAPWHDKQFCSSVVWKALSRAVGHSCESGRGRNRVTPDDAPAPT